MCEATAMTMLAAASESALVVRRGSGEAMTRDADARVTAQGLRDDILNTGPCAGMVGAVVVSRLVPTISCRSLRDSIAARRGRPRHNVSRLRLRFQVNEASHVAA